MRKCVVFVYQALLVFAFLGVLFIPFSFRNWNFQSSLTKFLFEDIILTLASHIKFATIINPEITSDSTTLYLLLFVLFFLAFILGILSSMFHFLERNQVKVFNFVQLVLVYYLAFIMLKYGFDKVFKAQFYLPEPNTLYTPLGMLDKDILYWSTIGVSYSYNIFMGLFEIIPAMLLLYKKTRKLGLFILSGVLLHVVFINFSFDISVKLFSSFLLLLNGLLLAPSLKKVFDFFVFNKPTTLPYLTGESLINSPFKRGCLKTIVVLLLFTECLLPYIKSGHYNDDQVPRIHLHGAYEVLSVQSGSEMENKPNLNVKRLFIHRNSYFIFQYEDDSMEDFYFNASPNQMVLTNYEGETFQLDYSYSEISGQLVVTSSDFGWTIRSEVIDWEGLPLLQPLFHWTVD